MPAFYVAGEESALHLPKVREIEERAMCVVHRNAVRFLLKFPCMQRVIGQENLEGNKISKNAALLNHSLTCSVIHQLSFIQCIT